MLIFFIVLQVTAKSFSKSDITFTTVLSVYPTTQILLNERKNNPSLCHTNIYCKTFIKDYFNKLILQYTP